MVHARLAQSVERWTLNPTVVGSSPTLGEIFVDFIGQLVYLRCARGQFYALIHSKINN